MSDLTQFNAPSETSKDTEKKLRFKTDKDFQKEFLGWLAEISGSAYSADDGVAYHTDPPTKISLPEGMKAATAAQQLADVAQAQAQTEIFSKTFKYRPNDGAYAVVQVLRQFFGTTGRGVTIQTMFGSIPPRQITIEVDSDGTTVQVPWVRSPSPRSRASCTSTAPSTRSTECCSNSTWSARSTTPPRSAASST